MDKKCLVVDDVEVSSYVISEIVRDLGFTVFEASDEKSTLNLIKKERFDVIILDWHLRKTQSLPLISEVREIPTALHTPIILCTGVELDKNLSDIKDSGAQGFLKKPTSPENVSNEFKRLSLL
ncbi:MAG: hypothetical protein DI551_10740 [Micavibrio aeruginosavorus]|uniref:Response regulatory domain-containing protein n=1 Tax=Micavibrio aeruginosavorus TaxID=349221 RepID=A0A2W5PYK3_9BACT|nr:MAG: hypothetical protein DI551_10740 [Micavibrio aeruginosavorus]